MHQGRDVGVPAVEDDEPLAVPVAERRWERLPGTKAELAAVRCLYVPDIHPIPAREPDMMYRDIPGENAIARLDCNGSVLGDSDVPHFTTRPCRCGSGTMKQSVTVRHAIPC